ncbi:MAG: DUF3422 domain-containing protein [Alphaproteobacteria bacterium]|nr:hypothetical protein [Rhodospirillaceae bacterium]MDP6020512.1 DUF3422 domain-containing protein [Alphaproteobacteria bacterium]MDP6253858.1 DUF3422 domain-containing protein [Alphaproteobacteria bacterium]MDP7052667.1 DUF3422 domain-containing protein [Alphaproteobacteria bacterium]MDP7229784.1 DUF3422 domain-containing protein [Alphaproteobacteria bacterium]
MRTMQEHPLRYVLANEIHDRPFPDIGAPEQASYLVLFSSEDTRQADRKHLLALCERYGSDRPPKDASHFAVDLGSFKLKWERHSEFTAYTFFHRGEFARPFAEPPVRLVPKEWLSAMPGELIYAVHLAVEPGSAPERTVDDLSEFFVTEDLCSSYVGNRAAQLWTDFRIHEDGFGRILISDMHLAHGQAGRLAQRLLEIGTYRTMALLALPLARENGPTIMNIDHRLAELTQRINDLDGLEEERQLLDNLMRLSGEIEAIAASTVYRFSATEAYYPLVGARLAKLREERVKGHSSLGDFLDRRLGPATRTCQSIAARQEMLARRVARAANLLRTRIDITLERQNRDLLASMNRRARLHLRLQKTVEALSVAAITYYLVSLVGYALSGLSSTGVEVDVGLVRGLSIPLLAALAWFGMHRARRAILGEGTQEDGE